MKANELQVYEILLLHPAADSGRKFFWEGKREADGRERERVKRVWYTHYVATFNRITTTSLGLRPWATAEVTDWLAAWGWEPCNISAAAAAVLAID